MKGTIWRKFGNREVVSNVKEQLLLDIAKCPIKNLTFHIGSDSQVHKNNRDPKTIYIYGLFIRMPKKGVWGYYVKDIVKEKVSMHQRLFLETYKAVEAAILFNPLLESIGYKINDVQADLNEDPNEGSHVMLQSCMGYIKGYGFEAVSKPNSWASTYAANKLTK